MGLRFGGRATWTVHAFIIVAVCEACDGWLRTCWFACNFAVFVWGAFPHEPPSQHTRARSAPNLGSLAAEKSSGCQCYSPLIKQKRTLRAHAHLPAGRPVPPPHARCTRGPPTQHPPSLALEHPSTTTAAGPLPVQPAAVPRSPCSRRASRPRPWPRHCGVSTSVPPLAGDVPRR